MEHLTRLRASLMLRQNLNAVAIGIAAGSLAGFLFAVFGVKSPIAAFLISGAVSSIVAVRILNPKSKENS